MAIFNSYVSFPEGKWRFSSLGKSTNEMVDFLAAELITRGYEYNLKKIRVYPRFGVRTRVSSKQIQFRDA